jgi:DNA polymerase III alpha subunit
MSKYNKNNLYDFCLSKLDSLSCSSDTYKKRFESEWKEISAKGDVDYFLSVQDSKYTDNEHNLLTPYLMGIVPDFDINKPSAYDQIFDPPDVDVDYIDGVREYLKEDYAKELFGEEYVCNIANYNTFGMKSALKACARVFGLDYEEAEAVTKHLKDKDEDGKALTWEQAMELYDELKDYCELHPEVSDAAKRIMNRNQSLGQHASGLIVSSVRIRDYVPLIRGKEGSPASSWIEGLHGTDLSTVGFVKFDFLGLDGNSKIATTIKMGCVDKKIKKTNELINDMIGDMTVCALPDQPSWSDTSYLNDKKALAMADKGDLRMIFQFDGSPGIRRLAREGGVTSFDDLVAYTALYRPGPMKLKYHERYVGRKRNLESWSVHPLLAEGDANLSFTYDVLCYQEQIARMLHDIGKVPWADCEVVRKAISKKKVEKFLKYKEAFVIGGQETLQQPKEYLEHLWDQIEAFAGYGFNLSHAVGYTYISSRMLWLKAHLPKRFFASMFTHTKASGPKDYNKLKEYKREAEKNGVKMAAVDVNKSKRNFIVNMEDDTIYYGFEKIKGIGEEAAKKIEELQPYKNFEDFLQRFGTDAKTVQALISLGCWKKEASAITLYKFYEHYKKFIKSEADRIKRYEKTKGLIEQEILEASDQDKPKFIDKLSKCIANKEKKDMFAETPTLSNFDPDSIKIKIKEDYMEVIKDQTGETAEIEYYGYVWQHPIEKIPGYQGQTFDDFIDSEEKTGEVEALVTSVKKARGKQVDYYSIQLEDASGRKRKMTVWNDEYERFKDALREHNVVRLTVDAPKPPYPTFQLQQFRTWRRLPAIQDHRVILLGNIHQMAHQSIN